MNKENSQYIFLNFPDLDFQEKSVGFYPTFYSTYHGMHYNLSVYEDGPFTYAIDVIEKYTAYLLCTF